MTSYHFQSRAGQIHMPSDFARQAFKKHLQNNEGAIFDVVKRTPESRQQRKFYHSSVLQLWAFLDGKDYKDSNILDQYHELAKIEFNGELIHSKSLVVKVGRSTRGKLHEGYLERIVDHLEQNYGIDRAKVLDPKLYRKFMEEIYPFETKYETFIDYMLELNLLPII